MKNAINHYYNLYPDKIYKESDHFYFYLDDIKINIYKLERNITELLELVRISNELYKNKILVSTFIINKNGGFYFNLDEENYSLLKVNNYEKDTIDYYDISKFNKILSSLRVETLNNLPWNISWTNTIDRLEEAMKEYNKEFVLIQDRINYYIGLAENAVMYINNISEENKNTTLPKVISHKRINSKTNIEDFYNPLNIMFDYEIRDLAFYVQNSFFDNTFDFDELEKYLNFKNFNRYSIGLFYGRLLYPSYYFDKLELILNGILDEKVLNYYHDKTTEYEDFLYDLYNLLKLKYSIPKIDWINEKNE